MRNITIGQVFFRDEDDTIIRYHHKTGYCFVDDYEGPGLICNEGRHRFICNIYNLKRMRKKTWVNKKRYQNTKK